MKYVGILNKRLMVGKKLLLKANPDMISKV